ncbi:unnamed protein product [Acidithrix sp. C25]|nr:unnamed protein product [Acidithrix sp. C25]
MPLSADDSPDRGAPSFSLDLPSVHGIRTELNEGIRLVEGRSIHEAPPCPKCGDLRPFRHGTKVQRYIDLPVRGVKVVVDLERQRYRCKQCSATYFNLPDGFDHQRSITTRLRSYLERKALTHTFYELAREVGVDEKTVRNVFNDYLPHLQSGPTVQTPTVLGIDEVHTRSGYHLVVTNVLEKTIIEMFEKRNRHTVDAYLSSLPDAQVIQVVTMDMWRPYRDGVRKHLPDAQVVIDKFHVVKMANQALETIRKAHRATLSQSDRIQLKQDRFLMLYRRSELDESQSLQLDQIFDKYPSLAIAHASKEAFFDIYACATRTAAETALEDWKSNLTPGLLPAFKPLLTALTNWHDEIFAYFDYRYTNALTESMNALIKIVNHMGKGYSFDILRAKMLYAPRAQLTRSTTTRGVRWSGTNDYLTLRTSGHLGSSNRPTTTSVRLGTSIPALIQLCVDDIDDEDTRSITQDAETEEMRDTP